MTRVLGIALGAALALAAPAAACDSVRATEDAATLVLRCGGEAVTIAKSPWHLAFGNAAEATAAPGDPLPNADAAKDSDPVYAHNDIAYPGLSSVTYAPLSYLAGGTWQHVTALRSHSEDGTTATLGVATSDGGTAAVTLDFRPDRSLDLHFAPPGGATAVEESFAKAAGSHFAGGGQRMTSLLQDGKSIPLWISHGPGSDRYWGSNEIAVPFLLSTAGWGFAAGNDARGEINVGVPTERPDALNVVFEDDHLDLTLYRGSPARILRDYTARIGRPERVPPDWALRPMFWEDTVISQDSAEAEVGRLRAAGIPVGAWWIDNPWQVSQGDFAPDPKRFPDFDGMIARFHAAGVHVMAWASVFVPGNADWTVGNIASTDMTYLGGRGPSTHTDLTDPRAVQRMTDAAAALLRRGVDGFKLDRGEEDLGENARFANGLPNRLNHNPFVVRYDRAIRAACDEVKPDDCFVIARGGWTGTSHYVANWAADNLSSPSVPGTDEAMHGLLSLSLSGQPYSGSDAGGYTGLRQGTDVPDQLSAAQPAEPPTKGTFLRWTELSALSPIMETDLDPTSKFGGDADVLRIFKRYAVLHDRLVPYTARWARVAQRTGMPIVRPLLLAFPGDPVATTIEDEYLFGPDLLVAPITSPVSESGADARTVYLPRGGWTDAWSGTHYDGPAAVPVAAPLDTLPLFVRDGARLPAGLFVDLP